MPATLPQSPVSSAKSTGTNPWPATNPALASNVSAGSYVLTAYSNYASSSVSTVLPTDPVGGDTYALGYDPGYTAAATGGYRIAGGFYLDISPSLAKHSVNWNYPSINRSGIGSILEINPGGSLAIAVDQQQTGSQQNNATSPLSGTTLTLGQADESVFIVAQLVATTGLSNAGLIASVSPGTLTQLVSNQTSTSGTALWFGYSLNWGFTTLTPSVSWSADASIKNVSYTVITIKNFVAGPSSPPKVARCTYILP